MLYSVEITNRLTGETVRYVDQYTDLESELNWWRNGNGECDCNRYLKFWQAKGEDRTDEKGITCGDSTYAVKELVLDDGTIHPIDSKSERRSGKY